MERGPIPQEQDVPECAVILVCATYLAGNGRELGYIESFIIRRCTLINVDYHARAPTSSEETLEHTGQLAVPEGNHSLLQPGGRDKSEPREHKTASPHTHSLQSRGCSLGLLVLAEGSNAATQRVQGSVDVVCFFHSVPTFLVFAAL